MTVMKRLKCLLFGHEWTDQSPYCVNCGKKFDGNTNFRPKVTIDG